MSRVLIILSLLAGTAHADDVFAVCKAESKTAVSGKGKMSIAVYYPDSFPVTTNPIMRNAVGARLATAEKAIIVPNKDVEAARKLVEGRKWNEGGEACTGIAPSLIAVLGLKHTNLATANASVDCDAKGACTLNVDLERHGKPTAERWVRYSAPLAGPKDKVESYTATAPKLVAKGEPPNHPTGGLAVTTLPSGKVTTRSDADGALEIDRVMESSPKIADCSPKGRKAGDIRGYWAEWKLSARGTGFQAIVHPFGGNRDPSDDKAADCLRKAIENMQLSCPRDGRPLTVKTAICL